MAELVIPSSYISLSMSTTPRTITLISPYDTLTLERIKSIFNLTTGTEIYNSDTPGKRKRLIGAPGADISITNGVITFVEDAKMTNGDSIKIVINNKNPSRNTELIGSELTVSTGGTPSAEITDVDTTGAKRIAVQVNNKGASTIVEVAAYCAVGSLAYTTGCIGSFNLDTTNRNDIMFLIADFDKVKVIATNKDTANATTVDIAVKVIDE